MSEQPPIDYASLNGIEFLKAVGTDARKWADAFMQTVENKPQDWIDHSFMVSWFANAIMAQYDEDHRDDIPSPDLLLVPAAKSLQGYLQALEPNTVVTHDYLNRLWDHYMPALLKAMGDASTRKDEDRSATIAPESSGLATAPVSTSPVNTSEISDTADWEIAWSALQAKYPGHVSPEMCRVMCNALREHKPVSSNAGGDMGEGPAVKAASTSTNMGAPEESMMRSGFVDSGELQVVPASKEQPVELPGKVFAEFEADLESILHADIGKDGKSFWHYSRSQMFGALEKAVNANAPERESGWQPIETAPKDGTEMLLINGDKGGYHTEPQQIGVGGWWKGGLGSYGWFSSVCCDGVSRFEPVGWQAIPENWRRGSDV